MDLNYSSEETDRSSSSDDDYAGSGRSFECIFCKRGFTTAQALGGHMNIHRKERAADKANNNKPTFPPSASHPNFSDLSFHSQSPSPSHSNSTPPRVQAYFPAATTRGTPSHLQYSDQLLCVENQRDAQDYWRKRSSLSFYANPFCADVIGDKFEESSSEDHGLDLELRLGNFP